MKVVLDEGAFPIERAHDLDAGYDIRTPIECDCFRSVVIDTGVHVEIPKGYVGFLKSKSGLNVNCHITGEGVIDAGYTGSIVVKLYKDGDDINPWHFKRGDKIIQLVILPILTPEIEYVDRLDDTDRGANGFGSTGA